MTRQMVLLFNLLIELYPLVFLIFAFQASQIQFRVAAFALCSGL